MAESENIGAVDISVGADFSALDAAFDAAVQRAVSEGQALSDAIASAVKSPDFSGITGSIDGLEAKWQQLGKDMADALGITLPAPDVSSVIGAMDQVAQAAIDATKQLDPVAGAAQQAGQGIGELGDKAGSAAPEVNSLVEQLSGLVVLQQIQGYLEGIVGSIAEAADSFTRANIALTTITGDADSARDTLSGLSQLGQSDGLSMPALQQAAVRLQQMLPAGADVVGILGNIADGAAVMGTSIDGAATKFFTLVDSGNASIKALAQLGLNFDSLADGINKVNPALGATADNAKALFKSLDDQGRIAALQGALSNLAGTAQQVAQQTFGGLWASLVAQWDQLLESAGEALLPLAKALKDFASADVIPALQAIVDAFKALPAPLQDAVLAMAGLAAAIVPIGAAVGGAALAVQALGGALAPLAAAFGSIVESAGLTDAALAGIGTTLAELAGPIGLVAVALSLIDFAPLEKEFSDFISQLSGGESNIQSALAAISTQFSDFITTVKDSFGDASDAAKGFMNALAGLGLDVAETEIKSYVDAINSMVGPLIGVKGDVLDFHNAMAGFESLTFIGTLQTFTGALNDFKIGIGYAKDAWDTFTGDVANSASATSAAADALTRLDAANRAISESAANAASGMKALSDSSTSYSDKLQDLLAKQVSLVGNVGDLQVALDQAKTAYDAGQISAGQLAYVQGQLDSATKSLYGTVQQMPDAFLNYKTALDNTSDDMKVFIQAENDLLSAHQNMIKQIAATGQSLDQYWADVRDQAEKSAQDYQNLLPPMAQAIQTIIDPLHTAQQAAKDAQAAFQSLFTIDPAPLNALGQAFKTLGANAKESKPDLDDLNGALTTVLNDVNVGWDDPRIITALGNIDKAAQQVGKVSLVAMADELGTVVKDLNNAGAPIDLITGQMNQWEAAINKLAKTDLPDAIDQQRQYIAQLQQMGGTLGDVLRATASLDQMQIQWGNDTGESADGAVYSLEQVRLKQQELALESHGFADSMVSAIEDINKGFDQMGQAMGQAIVNGQNMGDALIAQFKKIAASILGDLINAALVPLKLALHDVEDSLLSGLNGGLKVATGGFSDLSGAAGQTAVQMAATEKSMADVEKDMQQLSGDTTQTADDMSGLGDSADSASKSLGDNSGGLTKSANSVSGSLMSMVGVIAQLVTAVAAVIGDIYLAAIDTKLFHIETSLLAIQNDTANRRADAWSQYGDTYDRLGELLDRLNHIMDNTAALASGQFGSGATNSGVQGDLDLMVPSLQNVEQNTGYINTDVQAMNRTVVAEIQNVEMILYSTNAILGRIETSISTGTQSLGQSMSQSLGTMSQNVAQSGHAIQSAIQDASNSANTLAGIGNSNLADLQARYDADMKAMQDAISKGDIDAYNLALADSQAVQRQIGTIYETQQQQVGIQQDTYDATLDVQGAISAAQQGISTTLTGVGSGVIDAVNASATTIAQAIATMAQNPTGAGGVVQQPVPENTSSQNYVNPAIGTAPNTTGGGPVAPKVATNSPSLYVPSPTGNPHFEPPGQYPGGGSSSGNPGPYGSNPVMVPQYQTGGMVAASGLLAAEKGEAVLTPDQFAAMGTFVQAAVDAAKSIADNAPVSTPSAPHQNLPTPGLPETVPYGYQGPPQTEVGAPPPPAVDPTQAAQAAAAATGAALAAQMKTLYDEIQTSVANGATVQAAEFQRQYDALKDQLLAMTPTYGPRTYNGLVPNTGTDQGNGPGAKGPPTSDSTGLPGPGSDPGLASMLKQIEDNTAPIDPGLNAMLKQIEGGQGTANSNASKQEDLTQKIIDDSSKYYAAVLSGNQQLIAAAQQQLNADEQALQAQATAAAHAAQTASLDNALTWLAQNSSVNQSDRAIAAATYTSDATAGNMPVAKQGQQPFSFSGYNPYTTPITPTITPQSGPGPRALGVPSFDIGGMVPADMIAMIHAGEAVLPPDLTAMLRRAASQPAADGGVQRVSANITINAPITVNGQQDGAALAKTFVRHLKRVVPQGGLTS